jgi:intracellular multiplication protein IcmL
VFIILNTINLNSYAQTNQTCPCECVSAPLTQPCLATESILVFANEAVVSAYSYDFVNYKQQLDHTSHYFTTDGWQSFKLALDNSNNLNKVIEKKLVVYAVAQGSPVILSQGVVNNKFTWKVQMPTLITYQAANEQVQQHLVVTMIIVRTNSSEGMRGLGISSFVAA